MQDAENELRGALKTFGLKVGSTTRRTFAARIRELVADLHILTTIVEPLLAVRAVLIEQHNRLHKLVLEQVREDTVCRRLMTVPGVGPVVALSFKTAIDAPARFARSRSVGAYLGLTPRRYQSGEIDRTGRISKIGDRAVRTALFEAASVLLTRTTRWSKLKAWAVRLAQRSGAKTAKVALARMLAVILHRIWIDGTDFQCKPLRIDDPPAKLTVKECGSRSRRGRGSGEAGSRHGLACTQKPGFQMRSPILPTRSCGAGRRPRTEARTPSVPRSRP